MSARTWQLILLCVGLTRAAEMAGASGDTTGRNDSSWEEFFLPYYDPTPNGIDAAELDEAKRKIHSSFLANTTTCPDDYDPAVELQSAPRSNIRGSWFGFIEVKNHPAVAIFSRPHPDVLVMMVPPEIAVIEIPLASTSPDAGGAEANGISFGCTRDGFVLVTIRKARNHPLDLSRALLRARQEGEATDTLDVIVGDAAATYCMHSLPEDIIVEPFFLVGNDIFLPWSVESREDVVYFHFLMSNGRRVVLREGARLLPPLPLVPPNLQLSLHPVPDSSNYYRQVPVGVSGLTYRRYVPKRRRSRDASDDDDDEGLTKRRRAAPAA